MQNYLIKSKINQLQNIKSGKNWIGTNYDKKISALDSKLAFNKAIEELHSIAEIISHLTCWRNETILKLETGKGSISDDSELNWLDQESLKAKGWENILSDYYSTLEKITDILKDKNDSFLLDKYYDNDFKGKFSYEFLIDGMIHHDLYHLGQISILLKKLK